MVLCEKCAKIKKTCCQTADIYITKGDIERIKKFTGISDFFEFRNVNSPDYLDQDDDPIWYLCVFTKDQTRRVLKKKNDECMFLSKTGCILPIDVRPLVCRLYPYNYDESGITEIDNDPSRCPVELLPKGEDLIKNLGMSPELANKWHDMLYSEIRMEPNNIVVGITYDLRKDYLDLGYGEEETAEFDREETIEAIEKTLNELDFKTERIGNAKQLIESLSAGKRWDIVFNVAEGMHGLGREAQVPAILEVYNIPYTFVDTVSAVLCHHKGLAKQVLQNNKIPTPDFAIVENISDIDKITLKFPLFVKPVAEGTGKGISGRSKVKNREELKSQCIYVLNTFKQPAIVEKYLPGRNFTTGILGTNNNTTLLGTLEIIIKKNAPDTEYSYINKEQSEEFVEEILVNDPTAKKAESLALKAYHALGLRDSGRVDLRCDEKGNPQVLEINPLAGLHPQHSDLPIICNKVGISFKELIERIMNSALRRCNARSKFYIQK